MDNFGARLRAAREQRGISLRQIADTTKISSSVLDSLERNDFSRLPGGIFVRAFVRSYASEVGLDPEEMVREFLRQSEELAAQAPLPVHARVPEGESDFESSQRVARVLLRIVMVSIPLVGLTFYFTLRPKPAPVPPAPTAVPIAAPIAAAAQPSPMVPVAAPAEAVGKNAATAPGDEMVLVVRSTGPCWVDITVDGQRALSRVLQPGEVETLQVHDSAVIRVGDAGAFAFSINGQAARPLGAAGEVRTANITRESMSSFLR